MLKGESLSGERWYEGLTGYHFLVLVVASLGWAFDTMDQWLFVLTRQPALASLLNAAPGDPIVAKYTGIVQAIFIFGWATGGFLFGIVGDKIGRTRAMMITILLYAGFTGITALSQTWWDFAIYRFLCGLGVGGEFAAGAALVAEVFPERSRAAALGIMQASSALGNILAGLINLTIGASPVLGWRYVYAVGFFPALLVFIIRLFIREPERWERAKVVAASGVERLGNFAELFSDRRWRRNTIVGVSLVTVGVIGFWGIGTWSPDLLRSVLNPQNLAELKAPTERAVSIAIMMQNAGAFFGILAWAWLAERIGRRGAFACSFLLCLVVVPLTFQSVNSFSDALLLFPLMGFFTTSLFGGYAVYFPELYPTRLRATGTGFCYNVARYLAIAGPYTFGHLRAAYGIRAAGSILSLVFLLGLFVLPAAPETKGKPLPE
ncbi:MAG: MFS transporter [Armatimonadota bacterium]|nr:MFS transporter [Armatimonadota bacterium]MCX7778026.1 MFS transporter [Armatimonadota bacterium]MDW8024976.1 MFS transporter [Armatimonadota bacterium]